MGSKYKTMEESNMAENIIYCYSGAGHCLSMAKSIAQKLGDTDIVMMRSFPAVTDARGAKRVGFVFSCIISLPSSSMPAISAAACGRLMTL